MSSLKKSFVESLNDIEVEDLQYVESDLCFNELVSLGFLLYGDERSYAHFILQRLIILAQHPPQGKGLIKGNQLVTSDILRKYAESNSQTWKEHIVEALAITGSKRVLRKLGLTWTEVYHHYLPHIAEISVHIHPLLKALYIISERLVPSKACKLIEAINAQCHISEDLRFYDFSYLEMFLLHWINKRIIKIGDRQLKDCNIEILIEYFKLNDMEAIKDILLETINQNSQAERLKDNNFNKTGNNLKDCGLPTISNVCDSNHKAALGGIKELLTQQQSEYNISERYKISRKYAGYVLIINQSKFYKETNPAFKHLVPLFHDVVPQRKGTNVDRDKLKELFTSFGYIPLVFENLTHLEILHEIREAVKKSLLKDSLIICILSHGMEGVVFGCNTVPIAITEIKEILTNETLKGKPKMLIIQACQRNIATTVNTESSTYMTDFSPDAYADILLAMSSIPGTDALRHTEYGSWFVDALCKFTQKYGDSKHMFDILTAVTCDISKRKGEANQVMLPFTFSTMRKEFYLPRRV